MSAREDRMLAAIVGALETKTAEVSMYGLAALNATDQVANALRAAVLNDIVDALKTVNPDLFFGEREG